MSKFAYIFFIVGGGLATAILAFFANDPATTEAAPFVPVALLVSMIANLVMIGRMWSALPEGHRRTGPGAAVGLMFIPLFNIYWIFNVYVGYATDYNKYVESQHLQAPRISWGLLLAQLLLSWVPLVGLILQIMAISQICNGANAIRNRSTQVGRLAAAA